MRHIAKGLVFIVLISISVFFGITYYETYIKAPLKNNSENADVSDTILLGNGNKNENKNDMPTINYTSFPKTVKDKGDFYINNLGGSKDEILLDYFIIGDFVYVILYTDSNDGDFKATERKLAIGKFDSSGNILSTQVLNTQIEEKYLSASIYENGILILTTASTVKLYAVSLDLTYTASTLNIILSTAYLYYNYPYTLICGQNQNRLCVFKLNENKIVDSFETKISEEFCPTALFFVNNKYHLFFNDGEQGCVLTFGSNKTESQMKLAEQPFSQVYPYEYGFIATSCFRNSINVMLFHYDLTEYKNLALGYGKDVAVSVLENGILIITTGDVGQAFFLCKHGDIIHRDTRSLAPISEIYGILSTVESLEIIARLSKDTAVKYTLDYKTNTISESQSYYLPSAEKITVLSVKSQKALLTQTWENSSIFDENCGKTDIFLLIFK